MFQRWSTCCRCMLSNVCYCAVCFVMHLDCLNYRLYYVSLCEMALGDGKFMNLFFFVYRHVTSRVFIRRSRAGANLDIDARGTVSVRSEKVARLYRKFIRLLYLVFSFLCKYWTEGICISSQKVERRTFKWNLMTTGFFRTDVCKS